MKPVIVLESPSPEHFQKESHKLIDKNYELSSTGINKGIYTAIFVLKKYIIKEDPKIIQGSLFPSIQYERNAYIQEITKLKNIIKDIRNKIKYVPSHNFDSIYDTEISKNIAKRQETALKEIFNMTNLPEYNIPIIKINPKITKRHRKLIERHFKTVLI